MKSKTLFNNPSLADRAYYAVRKAHPRKRNFLGARPSNEDQLLGAFSSKKIHYRGGYKGYTGSSFIPIYTSVLTADNKRAIYRHGFTGEMKEKVLRAPYGTELDHDGSIVLSHDCAVEYHPTLEDLLSRNFAERVRAGLREAKTRRAAIRKLESEKLAYLRIFNRESGTVRVNLDDSRRAGNCVEGSLRYAEGRLGIERETVLENGYLFSVPACRLDDSEPCLRAIMAAWNRETCVQI